MSYIPASMVLKIRNKNVSYTKQNRYDLKSIVSNKEWNDGVLTFNEITPCTFLIKFVSSSEFYDC